ncbi:hypothetical protein [Bradyrhizobium sp. ARR65]|uniref:hypothetical protein n=1 Tax=Bradyrhizobium sp. ARR65 TaxID=1040989 RepID=UPI0012FCF253|nr:hypothetical protein [Bradyrhizobium sp. ARR65]
MTELYWLALVREVPFRDYATDALDWIIDPGGPSERLAIAVIAIGIAATVGLYLCTPIPRSVLFWSAFDLSGTWAALGGHVLMKSVECSTENAGASCRLGSISLKPQQSNGPIVENGFRTDRVKASTW